MVVNPAPLGAVPENVSRAPRGMKSPCTRSQMRRNPDSRERLASPGCEPSLTLDDLPDELVLHALTHLAFTEVVPGGLEPDDATLRPGSDAVVIGPSSRAARPSSDSSASRRQTSPRRSSASPPRAAAASSISRPGTVCSSAARAIARHACRLST